MRHQPARGSDTQCSRDIFTWWYGATIGARHQIGRGSQCVGEDEMGNRYFETVEKRYDYDGRNRRFVIYKGYADASKVSPDWHGWLHHTFDRAAVARTADAPRLGKGP